MKVYEKIKTATSYIVNQYQIVANKISGEKLKQIEKAKLEKIIEKMRPKPYSELNLATDFAKKLHELRTEK